MLTELPGTWWSYTLNELDSIYLLNTRAYGPELAERVPRLPSDYCREQVFVGGSFLARFEAEDAVAEGYESNVIWGSDYPHAEGTFQYPDSWDDEPLTRVAMRYTFAGIDADATRAHGRAERGARVRARRRRARRGRGTDRRTDAARISPSPSTTSPPTAACSPSAKSAPGPDFSLAHCEPGYPARGRSLAGEQPRSSVATSPRPRRARSLASNLRSSVATVAASAAGRRRVSG